MKKFEFKLQRLLEIRQKQEDNQKIELAKASGAYQLEANKKIKILDNIHELRQKIKDSKNMSLDTMRAYDILIQNSDTAINEVEREMEKKRLVMEEELKKYTELKQKRRAVEILKEKAIKEYNIKAQKEETNRLNEIGKNIYLEHNKE